MSRKTDVMRHRSGGDPSVEHLAPGQTTYEPIVVERGVSYDPVFEQWANKVFNVTRSQDTAGHNLSLSDFKKNLRIEVYNEAGQKVLAYNVYKVWVSDYQSLSDMDASDNAFIIQSFTIENEGWERDAAVTEPKEPIFTDPKS